MDLKKHYDDVYSGKLPRFDPSYAERKAIFNAMDWEGLEVLEIGCGEGDLSAMIATAGANIVAGCDISTTAIVKAAEKFELGNLFFYELDHREFTEKYNVIVMQGVLEHLDNPWGELKWMVENLLGEDGTLITSSPCFLNMRGVIWMTLALLFGAKMSLADKHYLHPWQFEQFAKDNDMTFKMISVKGREYGDKLVKDFEDRLPKALSQGDIKVDLQAIANVPKLLDWITHVGDGKSQFGENIVYVMKKRV